MRAFIQKLWDKGVLYKTDDPPRWGIEYRQWFFGLVCFKKE